MLLIDMEEKISPFVLETKKIEIPGYPDAFNPSIIRWHGKLLMSFRFRLPITLSTNPIALVWLDEDFNVMSEPQILDIPHPHPWQQDARLISIRDHLYVVYSNLFCGIRRMYVAEVFDDDGAFFAGEDIPLLHYDQKSMPQEKNWVPFDYDGNLLLAYSINPHCIFRPVQSTCETVAITEKNVAWDWGELRGGTPAHRIGDQYLAFFHSSTDAVSLQSNAQSMPHYVMGCYTFSLQPPFEITAISPEPIIGKNFYNGPTHQTWKPLRVVFPGGFVCDDQYIRLVYGRQDHECWVAKIEIEKMLDSLIPVR